MTDKFSQVKDVDIILIYPKTGHDFGATIAPPHSILALAAPIHKKGYKVKIIDQRIDPDWNVHLTGYLNRKPICVGISVMTGTQIYFALEIAKKIRKLTNGKIPLVWGGPHPSIIPEQTLQSEYVDAVCIGEGDVTFMEMVNAYEGKISLNQVKGIAFKDGGRAIFTPTRPLFDLEALLPVPWELIDVNNYIHQDFYIKEAKRSLDIGQTSRGCPFQCGFCCSASLRQRKWRALSAEKSLKNIVEATRRFNLDAVWFRDDEFHINRNRVYKICEGMVKAGLKIKWYTSGTRIDSFNNFTDEQLGMLKRSGADTLKFGAESGSDRILKLMNKGITCEDTLRANLRARKFDIIPAFSLMIGIPGETFDDINQTIDLFVRLKKDNPWAQFEGIASYTPFPGTPLYEEALKIGLNPPQTLEGWINWLCDEYDIDGRKMPWFTYAERKKIGNLVYMSVLANATQNALRTVKNDFLRFILKSIFIPISYVEQFKYRKKWYAFAPELDFGRYLRRKLFYSNYRSIK